MTLLIGGREPQYCKCDECEASLARFIEALKPVPYVPDFGAKADD